MNDRVSSNLFSKQQKSLEIFRKFKIRDKKYVSFFSFFSYIYIISIAQFAK